MLAIASDHAGFDLKNEIIKHLDAKNIEYTDYGTYDKQSCDYPDIAKVACGAVVEGKADKALLFCGTGIGISMAANKIKGIRAAACSDTFSAKYSRLHNNANALCLGGRVVGVGLAVEIADVFLTTSFEGGRHARRVDKIMELEK